MPENIDTRIYPNIYGMILYRYSKVMHRFFRIFNGTINDGSNFRNK